MLLVKKLRSIGSYHSSNALLGTLFCGTASNAFRTIFLRIVLEENLNEGVNRMTSTLLLLADSGLLCAYTAQIGDQFIRHI